MRNCCRQAVFMLNCIRKDPRWDTPSIKAHEIIESNSENHSIYREIYKRAMIFMKQSKSWRRKLRR